MLASFQTQSMIDEIKKTFKKRVKEHEWIDEKTTKAVFEKASQSFPAVNTKHFVLLLQSCINIS